jgi:hypothetical protein
MLNGLAEYTYERDRAEFSLGDTLDIKTGLILACLTFLAIQLSEFMKQAPLPYQTVIEYISVAALIVGGVFCVLVLLPREYSREAAPTKYAAWIKDLEAYRREYPDAQVTDEAFIEARIASANDRIEINGAINRRKSKFMFIAFWAAIVSFVANISTLAIRLF